MGIKTTIHSGNRQPLSVAAKLVVALALLLCAAPGVMADDNTDIADTESDFGLWDIFDKKEIVGSAKSAWSDGLADAGGNLILGIGMIIAIISILLGLLLGTGVMNLGRLGADNDIHSKGKSMVGTAIGSAIVLALGTCLVVMVLGGWL